MGDASRSTKDKEERRVSSVVRPSRSLQTAKTDRHDAAAWALPFRPHSARSELPLTPRQGTLAEGASTSGNLLRRRIAVHGSRDSSAGGELARKYGASKPPCSERRLPAEGGPAALRALSETAGSREMLARALDGIALFSRLSREDRAVLFDSMCTFDYTPGAFWG
jgi:hypothetical protein